MSNKENNSKKGNKNKPMIKRDYKILKKLDAGGMGVVYKALNRQSNEVIALKVLPPKFAKEEERMSRFEREILACSRLNHPNLIHIINSGCEDNLHFFTMEYFSGLSIRKTIKRDGPFSLERTANVAIQMAKGCYYAHKQSLIHRDLKPDNILINDNDHVKIIDFGLAKIRDITTMTRVDQALGTTRYLPPEMILAKPVTIRADIYQLGLIIYELLTGKAVFPGKNPIALIRSYVLGGKSLKSLGVHIENKGWATLLFNCLAISAENRYKNCNALVEDLEKLQNNENINPVSSKSDKRSKRSLQKTTKLPARATTDKNIKNQNSNKNDNNNDLPPMSAEQLLQTQHQYHSIIQKLMPVVIIFILIIFSLLAFYSRGTSIRNVSIVTTCNEATIKWISNRETNSTIKYSPMNETKYNEIASESQKSRHSIILRNLKAGQRYRFNVIFPGSNQSRQYVFETQKAKFTNLWFIRKGNGNPLLSFISAPEVICSVHYPGSNGLMSIKEEKVSLRHKFTLKNLNSKKDGKTKIKIKYGLNKEDQMSTEVWHLSSDQSSISR